MWVSKQTGLDWDHAQQALKDGFYVGHDIWHTTVGRDEPARIVIDKDWNLVTEPAPAIAVVLPADSPIPPPRNVGRWKPSPPELASKEWIAFEWAA